MTWWTKEDRKAWKLKLAEKAKHEIIGSLAVACSQYASPRYPSEISPRGNFRVYFLAGEVERFDVGTGCSGQSSYLRCYYRLKGSNTVYQETPYDPDDTRPPVTGVDMSPFKPAS